MRRPLMICFLLLAGLLMTSAHTTAFARSGKKHSRSHKPASYRSPRTTLASYTSTSAGRVDFDQPRPRLRPWGANFELFGRGGIYSANLEYSLISELTAGVGFSYQSVSVLSATADVISLPFYANYYPLKNTRHRALISGGVTLLSVQVKSNDLSMGGSLGDQEQNFFMRGMDLASITLPVVMAGGGYEFRAPNGLMLRSQLYLAYITAVQLTFGAGLGYNF